MSVILVFKKSETTPANNLLEHQLFYIFLMIFFKTKSLSFLSSKSHT